MIRCQHACHDIPNRDGKKLSKHTVAWFEGWGGKGGSVWIDCRAVHEFRLTDDVEYTKPKKWVY